jgi:hypothetical protein
MRYSLKEFIGYTFFVVILFVVLTHAGGFANSVKAIGSTYAGGVRALEGR